MDINKPDINAQTQSVNTAQSIPAQQPQFQQNTKFCKHCGQSIPSAAVICTHCGCQVEDMHSGAAANQPIIINNNNNNNNNMVGVGMVGGNPKNKWVSFFLCLFLGVVGAHKFYEGKIGSGLLYLFTGGLFAIGVFVDLFTILNKPNPYYV
ncbi:MAG: TM2 domain-containing protein [Oscillospiraceae bacterium]|nr:TM2 domain-containing protein [Oscillospiraceae bacterium]